MNFETMKDVKQMYLRDGDIGSSKLLLLIHRDNSISLKYISSRGICREFKNVSVIKKDNVVDISYGSHSSPKRLTDRSGKLLPNWKQIL